MSGNGYGEAKPWEHQPNEPMNWYLRFKRYCRMGVSRSLLRAFNAEKAEKGHKRSLRISGAYEKRAKQFNWLDRAAAFDRHIEEREAAEWERRRIEYRKRETDLAESLIKKAEQMLQFPLATTQQKVEQDGGKTLVTNVFNPARWGMRDAAAIIDTADKLYRLAYFDQLALCSGKNRFW